MSNKQIRWDQTCLTIKKQIATDKDMFTVPTRRPAIAKLHNKRFEFVWSSFIFIMAVTTTMFKATVAGEATNVILNKIQGKVLSLRFHVSSGAYAQTNTVSDLTKVDEFWLLLKCISNCRHKDAFTKTTYARLRLLDECEMNKLLSVLFLIREQGVCFFLLWQPYRKFLG